MQVCTTGVAWMFASPPLRSGLCLDDRLVVGRESREDWEVGSFGLSGVIGAPSS